MENKELNCPKCTVSLYERKYMDKDIFVCPSCEGAIIFQKDLSHILMQLYLFLSEKIDFSGVVEKIPDEERIILCPSCCQTMEQHGYMGSKFVIIDNCINCGLIFVDKHELGVMALILGYWEKDSKQIVFSNADKSNVLPISYLTTYIRVL